MKGPFVASDAVKASFSSCGHGHATSAGLSGQVATKVRGVEILFTTLLVLAGVAITWFAVYVVYRLYADQR